MDDLTEYQRMRQAFLGENVQFLAEYGFEAPVVETTSVTLEVAEKENKKPTNRKKRVKRLKPDIPGERRASFRVRLKVKPDYFAEYEELPDSDEDKPKKVKRPLKSHDIDEDQLKTLRKPDRVIPIELSKSYGPLKHVPVGSWWETRLQCNYDGIHRPPVAGIHAGPDGAYSVALSGGYEDDVDSGDSFTYTGEGGRDLKGTKTQPKNLRTAPQSKDQEMKGGNKALYMNIETGNPVRVIRGYKLKSKFAPSHGYRYDGLYKVVKYQADVGKAGHLVYKFFFERCDPEPAPWCDKPKQTLLIQEEDDLKESGCRDCPPASIPEAGILTLWYEDVKQKVKLIGDQWHNLELKICAETSPFEHEAILQDIGWHGW